MSQRKSKREFVANAEKQWYLSLSPVNIQTWRIQETNVDSYSLEKKVHHVSLDKLIEAWVSFAQSNQPKLWQDPSKEPVKRILCHHFKKENNYAASNNLKFGEWKLIRNTSLPALTSTLALTSNPSWKAIMSDAKVDEAPKRVERRKHLWIVNILKKSVYATTITKHILNLGIKLTVDKLLTSAPGVKKQLIKAIPENKAVQFQFNTLEFSAVDAQNTQS